MCGDNIVGDGNNPTLSFGLTFVQKTDSRLIKLCNTAMERAIKPINKIAQFIQHICPINNNMCLQLKKC